MVARDSRRRHRPQLTMPHLLRSLARALASLMHPRVLWLTIVPLLVAGCVWGVVLWFSWSALIALVHQYLDQFSLSQTAYNVLSAIGLYGLHLVIAPFIVVTLVVPLIVVTVLLVTAVWAMPAVIRHLAHHRYAHLERRHGGSWLGGIAQAGLATVVCLLVVVVSLPLWLVPPFFAVIPPLLWGWLTYRVMAYDALAAHASAAERAMLMRRHRWPLLAMGIATGLLGSMPALLWVTSAAMIILFPFVALAAIWLYALIFVFSALWFAHFCLGELHNLRSETLASEAA